MPVATRRSVASAPVPAAPEKVQSPTVTGLRELSHPDPAARPVDWHLLNAWHRAVAATSSDVALMYKSGAAPRALAEAAQLLRSVADGMEAESRR